MNFEDCWYRLKKGLITVRPARRFDARDILAIMSEVEVEESEKGEKNNGRNDDE